MKDNNTEAKLDNILSELTERYDKWPPEDSLSFLKFRNRDLEGINSIDTWIKKVYGMNAIEFLQNRGMIKNKGRQSHGSKTGDSNKTSVDKQRTIESEIKMDKETADYSGEGDVVADKQFNKPFITIAEPINNNAETPIEGLRQNKETLKSIRIEVQDAASENRYDSNTVSIFPKEFEMFLPDGYRIDIESDDNQNEIINLRGGFKYDEDGEEDFDFSCSFIKLNVEVTDESLIEQKEPGDISKPGFWLDQVAESFMDSQKDNFGNGKRINLFNSFPASTIMKFYKPVSLFGISIDSYIVIYLVEVNQNVMFGFNTVYQDDSSGNEQFFTRLIDVVKSIRVGGEPVFLGNLTPGELERALDMDMDGDVEPLDLGLSIGIDIQNGEEETKYTINNDSSIIEEKINTGLKRVTPDEMLYPHYNSMLRTKSLGLFGATVIVNETGTEYKFYQLRGDLDEDEDFSSEKFRGAVSMLNDTGAKDYKLDEKSVEMRSVFHVSPDVFDYKHDRECELAEGYMHRAYMMSALRSFAWTVSKYCDDIGSVPGKLSLNQIHDIVDFIADNNWLNYDGNSFCKSLCGTQDLHVFYLPDNTPENIKSVFEPSDEIIEETKRIQESLPNYNPILSQTGSLDGLRNDLEYIYPAIALIYHALKEKRDIDEPLMGNDADILYSWCALAYAARGPFFSEDGPTTNFFSQIISEEEQWKTIDLETTEIQYTEQSSEEKVRTAFVEETEGEMVIVDNCWAIEVPEGFKYCTDKAVIGGHRNIIIMEDNEENEFDDPFSASISFTSMYNENGNTSFSAAMMAKQMYSIMGNDNATVLRDEDDLFVVYYYEPYRSFKEDGKKLDVFHIKVGCGRGVSSIQVFFNSSKMNRREQTELVDRVAKSIRINLPEYDLAKATTTYIDAQSEDFEKQKELFAQQLNELHEQAALYSTQGLSEDDQKTLEEVMDGIDNLDKKLDDIETDQAKFADHLRQKEEEQKRKEEERERKRAEYLASGNTDSISIDMFITLLNEKNMGEADRSEEEFCRIYDDDFPTLNKEELVYKRKEMLDEMKNPIACFAYAERFRNRSIKERFDVSTRNYIGAASGDFNDIIEEAVDNTAEWYSREEFRELRQMIASHMDETRTKLDDQLVLIEEDWIKFKTAKDYLKVVIKDTDADNAEFRDNNGFFQEVVDDALVEVELSTKGVFMMSTTLMNCFPWYWDTDITEIWSIALDNGLRDERFLDYDSEGVAWRAFSEIEKKHPNGRETLKEKADKFIAVLLKMYERPNAFAYPEEVVKRIMKQLFSDEKEFAKCRRYIVDNHSLQKIPSLKSLIDEGVPSIVAYDEIPMAISIELKDIEKQREQEQKE